VLLLAGCGGAKVLPASSASPLLGRALPEFRRTALDGTDLDSRLFRGRPVVVEFFAAYCEPCKRTLPATQQLSRENRHAVFVGISADDYASTARAVVAEHGLTFAVVHDSGHVLQGRFRVRELPVTFLADASGTVRWVGGPEHGAEELARALDAIE
jgi:cytochrome c biogenesis protein CcmG, thiol:disulfide interchange protein DsbE